MKNTNLWRFLTLSILAITITFSLSNQTKAVELLTNGSFETNMVGWTASTTNNHNPAYPGVFGLGAGFVYWSSSGNKGIDTPYSHASFPQDGSRSCVMPLYVDTQSAGQAIIRFYQDITVPSGNNLTISWKQRLSQINVGNSTPDNIRIRVNIRNTGGTFLQSLYATDLLAQTNEVHPWTTHSVNLGNTYQGQTIRLEFRTDVPDVNAPNYFVTKGMWEIDAVSANALPPTAAAVTLSGKVKDSKGKAMSQVRVRIMDMNGDVQSVLTNKFGYYEFREVEAGQTYAMEAFQKGVRFINNPRIINVADQIDGEDFYADDPTNSR